MRSQHRLSHRFLSLAGDHQLWKAAYYNRFVRPRASRIPGIRDSDVPATSLLYSSRVSKWLGDRHLIGRGVQTDWKRQYKIRHNWARGSCSMSQIEINPRSPNPPMLVCSCGDVVVTVDRPHGIRAWALKGLHRLLATLTIDFHFDGSLGAPTSLALEVSTESSGDVSIAIGYSDGSFGTYTLQRGRRCITSRYTHSPSSNGSITAIATSWPYLVTMTEAQLLSLYTFTSQRKITSQLPHLLASLKSHTTWPPLSLSLKSSAGAITMSIAYALPTYLMGWSVGLQELRMDPDGVVLSSRLASAATQGFVPLSLTGSGQLETSPIEHPTGVREAELTSATARPTSLSYSHPYLLASHTDNTLTLYLVSSSESSLTISAGSRLWGHTSSVSGAYVGDRGKAVSVSSYGDEIRLWELEGTIASKSLKRRIIANQSSVQVRAERQSGTNIHADQLEPHAKTRNDVHASVLNPNHVLAHTKGWVGVNDERIVVLREKEQGPQHLVLYDFA